MLARLFVFFIVCWVAVMVFAPMPPKEEGAKAPPAQPPSTDCDLGAGPCTVDFDETHGITLSIAPRPIRVVSPLAVGARFRGAATNAKVTFTSTTMDMGTLRVPLAPTDDGLFMSRTALPLCTTATMHWQARVDVDLDGEAHHAIFAFKTERSTTAPNPEDLKEAGVAPAVAAADTDVFSPVDPTAPPVVVDATFQSASGPVSLKDLRGHLALVTFGYASCPDVCPMGLSYLGQTLKRLSDDERARVKTLFISVDPARDTLEHLATYGPFFHPDIRGVSADEATLKAAAAPFGVSWAKVGADGGPPPAEGYLIDHTAFVSVVDADGRLVGRIAHAANPAAAAAVIRRFLPGAPK